MNQYHCAITEIVNTLCAADPDQGVTHLHTIIKKTASRHKLHTIPKLVDIIAALPAESKIGRRLRAKPVRTASGVAVIAVMCRPHRCPHIFLTGNICIYCPGGPDSAFEYSAQSYTGYEPTSMRAVRARYDPYVQGRTRLMQLRSLGHCVDKIEFIVMGGTFLSLPRTYKEEFIRDLHDVCSGRKSANLETAIVHSEQSKVKCVGITIETRPDYCYKTHISEMLRFGCTRVEIGVQSIYERIAVETNRGHTVQAVCHSFALAKDAGYKVISHMMPNLPNVSFHDDILQFREFFSNPKFRPDGLKIYPTLVIRDTGLYELWKNKQYKSYSPDVLIDILARILMMVPPYIRIYRVQRDIPLPLVSSGVEHGNIRQLALQKIKDYNGYCRDTRTREVGIKRISENITIKKQDTVLVRRDYWANNGWETFLSFEDVQQDVLVGMLRLRKCSTDVFREELKDVTDRFSINCSIKRNNNNDTINNNKNINRNNNRNINRNNNRNNNSIKKGMNNINSINVINNNIKNNSNIKILSLNNPLISTFPQIHNNNSSIIRELHVYGSAVSVDKKNNDDFQHKGYGKLLLEEAEKIAREEHLSDKISIISGVGTRNYYRKYGYELDGVYMSKYLY